jgi:hypothetical protein
LAKINLRETSVLITTHIIRSEKHNKMSHESLAQLIGENPNSRERERERERESKFEKARVAAEN